MILEIVGQGESIRMAKYQSHVMLSATDFGYRANDLNCLYFDGDARGLEQFIVQNNILFECRTKIN
jgi:hypothetical protein